MTPDRDRPAHFPTQPEDVYRTDLVQYPGTWGSALGKSHLIYVSDEELERVAADPDAVLDTSLTWNKESDSLRTICERGQRLGHRMLTVAFDHFFAQYRPGQHGARRLTPDRPETARHFARIAAVAKDYGLALELSLLSPLEIGPGYREKTGECGRWMQYRKGLRDPKTGAFSVSLWRQERWSNNKGPLDLEAAGVRVFAFKERRAADPRYRVVDPNDIIEITEGMDVEEWEAAYEPVEDYRARRIRVHGTGSTHLGDLDRVMVVQLYHTPEMDYFSPGALPYLKDLVDTYADAGVELRGLYSDEMHIQQDWRYFDHHDHGEFTLRYVSRGFEKRFADKYGAEYEDFAKWLVYFIHGQEDDAPDLSAKADVQHVLGDSPADIARTTLLRSRYLETLQDGVADLFVKAKRYAEDRMGRILIARNHTTWAESPTIDHWDTYPEHHQASQYEYTSNFQWSCTVHQAAAACHDNFAWGDYLTGGGTDHAECGWADRNYYSMAYACSMGILNHIPMAYSAHWGMPRHFSRWRHALEMTFGTFFGAHGPEHYLVQDCVHRDVEVMMLYPLDLVAATERFGSWMTQYGYANSITSAKLLERGEMKDGALYVAGRRFTTLVAQYEPTPRREVLAMMREMAGGGGLVIWSGPPPVVDRDGNDVLSEWADLFGLDPDPRAPGGLKVPGRNIVFEGALGGLAPMTVLTDFPVDRVYPAAPRDGSVVVARMKGQPVGTHRRLASGGQLVTLGFRPRDDQSASLGTEARWWFETLLALGAYPGTGAFPGVNDNTEAVSRTSDADVVACRFPNGATSIARHWRRTEEAWPGGFGRNDEEDAAYFAANPAPSSNLRLRNLAANGHRVTYDGDLAVSYRLAADGTVESFAGNQCAAITVDGRETRFGGRVLDELTYGPVPREMRVDGGATFVLKAAPAGPVRVPAPSLSGPVSACAEGPAPGTPGDPVVASAADGWLEVDIPDSAAGRWIYVVAG